MRKKNDNLAHEYRCKNSKQGNRAIRNENAAIKTPKLTPIQNS